MPLKSPGWLNIGCPRLCSANFSAGLSLQCRGIRRPSTYAAKLDVALNGTLRIISGCLKPIRRKLLPVLTGISPTHLPREHSIFELALQVQLNTNHPLHAFVHSAQTLGTQHLHSRHPFRCHAAALINSGFNILGSWRAAWVSARPPAQFVVTPAVCLPPGLELPRSLWVALNRLRTGVDRFDTYLYCWGMLDTPKCICGAEEQLASQIIFACDILHPPNYLEDLRPYF